jgi:hypothetical protein
MSQTACKRCGFLPPMRRLYAGGDLFRPNSIRQCADRALMHSEHPPKGLLHPPDLPSADTQLESCQRHVSHRARRPH